MNSKIFSLDTYKDFDSAYWGLGTCSDGNIYFGLCSHIPGKSAGFFRFDPNIDRIEHLFNVDEILGTAHGKIHTPILEAYNQKLYFGTHFAYPYGNPSNQVDYEGGHVMAYDPATDQVDDLGIVTEGEGILTIALNKESGKIYSLTVPGGVLTETDISSRKSRRLGVIPSKGSICRTITIDRAGKVYGSFEPNGLFIYDPSTDKLQFEENFFPEEQIEEWDDATRGGVNKIGRNLWRCVNYDEQRNSLYGIYAASSRLFKIDCETLELEIYDQLTPAGFASAEAVYPTLTMVSDSKKIIYAPADGMFDYCRSDNLKRFTEIMVFDKESGEKTSFGEIDDDGMRIFGAAGAVLSDECLYLLGASEAKVLQQRSVDDETKLFQIKGDPMSLSLIRIKM